MYLNMGNTFYSEVGYFAGITNTDWSWGPLLSDYDNDGYRDLFITNGFRRNVMHGDMQLKIKNFVDMNRHRFNSAMDMFTNGFDEFINLYDGIKLKNYLFKNNGDLTFSDVSDEWGFTDLSYSNGSAVADFDNDGDLDIVVNNMAEEAFLFENTQNKNNYIEIELNGPELNPFGLGAYISIYYDSGFQFYENKTVRGYLSTSTHIPHFGLGKIIRIDSLKVRWTDGQENILTDITANQTVTISYGESKTAIGPIFQNKIIDNTFKETTKNRISDSFVHNENDLLEYKDQMLLPHQFSKSGPFISVGDFTGDGLEDFFIGGAKGQSGRLYKQNNNNFKKVTSSVLVEDKNYEDMGSVFFDVDGDRDLDLYVVSGGSEYVEGHAMYKDRLYLNNGTGNFTKTNIPKTISSGSCVVSADYDQDGDNDLFIGGQVLKGQYPHPPKSYVFVNEGGKLVEKTEEIAPDISRIGMVNSAIFADIKNDNKPELIIVGEWMPSKVFEYSKNRFHDISLTCSLDSTHGWWNKVEGNDLDNDGDQDLIVGNVGENYKFKASSIHPFQVFANDYDRNGTNDILLAYYHGNSLRPVRGKEILNRQLPIMQKVFPTYNDFAMADMLDILVYLPQSSIHLNAYEFSSLILINEGGKFTRKKLPDYAQFSTLNSLVINDLNLDGIKDLIIGGNKFDVEVETTPADASPGSVLVGKGNFEYDVKMPYESGFFIPYNVKDIQLIEIGESWSVLVSANNDSLRIFEAR